MSYPLSTPAAPPRRGHPLRMAALLAVALVPLAAAPALAVPSTPEAVVDLAATPLDSAVQLSFDVPESDGGSAITGYEYSVDDGDTWADAGFDAPLAAAVSALMPAAYHIDTAWAGTPDGRLLLSSDRGRSWATVAQGLAPVRAIAAVRLA